MVTIELCIQNVISCNQATKKSPMDASAENFRLPSRGLLILLARHLTSVRQALYDPSRMIAERLEKMRAR
jgi:hypothetical protein